MKGEPTTRYPLTVHFDGPAVARQRLRLRDLLRFASEFQTAVDRVARVLQGGARSIHPGRRLGDIERACSLEILSVQGGGSMTMVCDLPPVSQKLLPDYSDLGEQALRALVGGLDAFEDDQGRFPQGYDEGVLLALRDASDALDHGISEISFTLGLDPKPLTRTLTPASRARIIRRIQAPIRNRRVVEGRLLMADFRESSLRCRVHPAMGAPITCAFDEDQRASILSALTHFVRVTGEATEVAGEVHELRIQDVELLDDLGELGGFASQVPRLSSTIPTLDELAKTTGARTLDELLQLTAGLWPEDERAEDLVKAVRRWRAERDSGDRT